jgi:hypothetical protein
MADPWLEAAVNQPRPSAPRPISVDEGRPSGVRTVNLNSRLSQEPEIPASAVFVDKNVVDLGQISNTPLAEDIAQNLIASTTSLMDATGLEKYRVKLPLTELYNANALAMESGYHQDQYREFSLNRKQQERPRGGAEINNARTNELLSEYYYRDENLTPQGINLPSSEPETSSTQEFLNQQVSKLNRSSESTNANVEQPRGRLGLEERRELRTRPGKGGVYESLIKAGIPEFEVQARVQAYANASDPEEGLKFLDPEYNANTVGKAEFADALDIVNARHNRYGEIVSGDLRNPEGEVRKSLRNSYKPMVQTKDGGFDPMERELGTVEGSVSVTPGVRPARGKGLSIAQNPEGYEKLKQAKLIEQNRLGEQYKKAIDDFGGQWDSLYQASLEDPSIPVRAPRRESRQIDTFDLDIPTRIIYDENGEPIGSTLYRDLLAPEVVEQVEKTGTAFVEDVPFAVNKARALADAEAFGDSMPELHERASAYTETGKALARIYEGSVKPLESSKTVQRDMGIAEDYNPLVKF